ncbi:MAG: FAD-binding oxidoreductase [Pseudomonadales bacterium]|nr:FAD-binding oxidoreductase [Pseudomonadales bacterium]
MTIDLIALARVVGEENLVTDPAELAVYGTDWTRFFEPAPGAVVFARSTQQVIDLVLHARTHRIALVPSGGRTGLSGGAVAADGEVVVSFEKMDRILDFNRTDSLVRIEPGVVTARLQSWAEEQGLFYPVDFASAGSSEIGGNIATNAGGIKVLRYGMTRRYVAGLKVVTGAGELLDLNRGLTKNATGYDFRHLFVGSEGTLGFIVEATMQLVPPPGPLAVALLATPKMQDVMSILAAWREKLPLTAFEFFSDRALAHVLSRHEMPRPLKGSSAFYALVEFEGDREGAMEAFEACVEKGWVTDGVLSQSEGQRTDLWRYREYISESISPHTPYKNDISVRISRVPALLGEVDATVQARYPDFEIVWFGHIGDGNVHLNILKPADWSVKDFKRECEQVSEEVLAIVRRFEGSISAEHGVGLIKRDQLHFSRSEEEIRLLRSVKRLFDPDGIMNPGKLISP